jgi:hypothetical protein
MSLLPFLGTFRIPPIRAALFLKPGRMNAESQRLTVGSREFSPGAEQLGFIGADPHDAADSGQRQMCRVQAAVMVSDDNPLLLICHTYSGSDRTI